MTEKIILVGVILKSEKNIDDISPNTSRTDASGTDTSETNVVEVDNLQELEQLTKTAGGQVVYKLTQYLNRWNSSTLIGSGKIEEIKSLLEEVSAHKVIIDHHLSGIQQRNLEQILKVPVLDRTLLILDIFAQRARSKEGKMQVELAQLLDQKSRMVGAWLGSLSRLGGGIGTRGPGEKALEVDRRTLARRIHMIQQKLKMVCKHRKRHRQRREKKGMPRFALIGYTNAGKSSLFNCLTKAQVYTEDKLFATLDPTTRKVFFPNSPPILITDTVGFIKKLPTKLIEAFKATLEEASDADALIHVVDLSSPQWREQMEITMDLITDLGWSDKSIIYVFNKVDQVLSVEEFNIIESPRCFVSAKSKKGIDQLKEIMTEVISNFCQEYELFFPLDEVSKIYELARKASITKQEEHSLGINCRVLLTPELLSQWKHYLSISL